MKNYYVSCSFNNSGKLNIAYLIIELEFEITKESFNKFNELIKNELMIRYGNWIKNIIILGFSELK